MKIEHRTEVTVGETSWPSWAQQLKRTYVAGGASVFLLHGNVTDPVGTADGDNYAVDSLADFLTKCLFGGYDIVLHYDVGRGLRAWSAGDPARLTRINAQLTRLLGPDADLPRDPIQALRTLDRLVSLLLVGEESRTRRTAFLFDYADLICPNDERGGEALATFLNWARSPVIRRVNLAVVLMSESLARLHPALVQSGHTAELNVPMPTEADRREFILRKFPAHAGQAERLAVMSAGLTLNNLDSMMRLLEPPKPKETEGAVKGESPDAAKVGSGDSTDASDVQITALKKSLIEAQCPDLLEFVQPKFDLSLVAGHSAAKQRLADDATLVREGRLDAVPMGYLLCGPVGVGKTFLAMCYAGTVGLPCVTIRNFRSKYVGDTEANMERILSVVRELGPVAVIIDEADAAVGNRGASGDSGTSARVFAQLASQMGDTRYRGKIIWFMLTCRPDLLPIDLKRQGRCEEHIPLFYPQSPDELREMFLSMGKKAKLDLGAESLPDMSKLPALSGADIEAILMRAKRESFLRGKPVDATLIEEVLKHFRSARGTDHEFQWLAAVMECSDLQYLPEKLRAELDKPGAFEALAARFHELEARQAEA